mmetsp:Transcript_24853/g.40653  ORF Transcript_24853/g.40653 Transcript_24853/m.40653 type:complete len:482 (+) Transcript_24853:181-1626(+)|eukprot:CAMPEP_0178751722 /NCGR_PEP_ID=MMETSP0744-20121128/10675_1 /TAXON_ID=913974 /ORGANISM="Nitzschia punctata, Strain CCMP561" /LENGTH=481 /DNA_ID=CAMNT_0020405381 /DNA_START=135 /DNA_END=1580 /DNA_ORIENTATION=-
MIKSFYNFNGEVEQVIWTHAGLEDDDHDDEGVDEEDQQDTALTMSARRKKSETSSRPQCRYASLALIIGSLLTVVWLVSLGMHYALNQGHHSTATLPRTVVETMVETTRGDVPPATPTDEGMGRKLVDDGIDDDWCSLEMKVTTTCVGCDENLWSIHPWCYFDLNRITFLYTGCPCFSSYSVDHSNSTFDQALGKSDIHYGCWMPHSFNESDIPSGIVCQDYEIEGSIEDDQTIQPVSWMAVDRDDASKLVGSGDLTFLQEYSIASVDPSTPLPEWVNLTFFGLDKDNNTVALQTTTFPTDFCVGFPDPWYHHGWPHMHVVEVQDLNYGNISLRDTARESLWINVTVDATDSAVPVQLKEMTMISNMFGDFLNMTEDVNGVILIGSSTTGGITTTKMTTATKTAIKSRDRIHESFRRDSKRVAPRTSFGSSKMEMAIGPITLDLYWRTRYTFFGTVIGNNANDPTKLCNGFAFVEYITGMA